MDLGHLLCVITGREAGELTLARAAGETFVYHLRWGPKCEIKSSPSAEGLWKAQGKKKKKRNRPSKLCLPVFISILLNHNLH